MNRSLLLFLFPVLLISCSAPVAEFEVSSQQIYREFQENEVAAFSKYKGKRVRVTGEIIGFNNIMGRNYCYIGSHGDFIGEIECLMSDEFSKNAGNYKIGQVITMEGTIVDRSFTGVIQMK